MTTRVPPSIDEEPAAAVKRDVTPRMKNMLVPMLTMVGVILAVLIVTGDGNPTAGNGMQSLLWGCMISVLVIAVMCRVEKLYSLERLVGEMLKGMATMLPIACILLLGLTMGTLVKQLDTGNYLSSIFMSALVPELLPLLTFIISMMLSFATGTSMGTMAIMSVIALPMAINMGMDVPLVAGALFGGSIFGDHVSPISDTTIMSCATTGCNIIDHVKTPAPLRRRLRARLDGALRGAGVCNLIADCKAQKTGGFEELRPVPPGFSFLDKLPFFPAFA